MIFTFFLVLLLVLVGGFIALFLLFDVEVAKLFLVTLTLTRLSLSFSLLGLGDNKLSGAKL